ncbi:MAG: succinylglutamate desuccinylase/aspartoacylase family protein [Planctomycetota bacterium]|nr:succinylglutamate desuccinylase/aspartoacylase family protein [Planctomycetota bacterium]
MSIDTRILRSSGKGLEKGHLLDHRKGNSRDAIAVLFGGIHGNEPAGVRAIQIVLAEIEVCKIPLLGEIVAVVGNRGALAREERYIERDLNRRWFPELIEYLRKKDRSGLEAEDREQMEIMDLVEKLEADTGIPLVFLDLHSTSGHGSPFSLIADVLRNRSKAFSLPIPVLFGLEEIIEGSMLGYLCDRGHVGIGVEGGQHDDPNTIANHVAAIWLVLVVSGVVARDAVPQFEEHEARLAKATQSVPRAVEIRHRHVCYDGDGFRMEPGYENFQRVRGGTVVAHDHSGPITFPWDGIMVMPRYQGQGEDGFFSGRELRASWLRLGRILRKLRIDRMVSWMPGVSPHPTRRDHFIVNQKIARFKPVEILHLLGYRHERMSEYGLVFSRRGPDFHGTPGGH